MESQSTLDETSAKEASEEFLDLYKKNVVMYATRILDLTNGQKGKKKVATVTDLNEPDVQHFFFKYIQMNKTLQRQELTGLHPDDPIICEEKYTIIWAQYVFLVLTNRHPIYTPNTITLNGTTKKIPPRIPFGVLSTHCRQVSEDLEEYSKDLLEIASNVTDGSISSAVLHYMIAFSRWMILMDDVKQHKKLDTFVSDVIHWCKLKRTAASFILLNEEEFQVNQPWAGCSEWLSIMECVHEAPRREINRKQLFDSLLKMMGE